MTSLGAYRKTAAAFVGTVLTWALPALVQTHGHPTGNDWYGLAVALATTAGVFGVSNDLPQTAWHSAVAALGFPAAGGRANEPADLAPDPRP